MDGVNNISTTYVTTTSDEASDCTTYERGDYEIALLILSLVMGLFGLVYTFVGYRCFKAVMFLSGFIFGGTVVYVICQEEKIVTHNLSLNAIIGISIGIAVLCGLITMLVVYVGLFLQGFFLGLLIAIGAILALSKFYHPETPWIPFGILFGTGILFILLTLKWQKTFLIIGTSIMGAALICSCLQYFLGKFSLHRYIWVNLMAESYGYQCWFFPIILGLWPGLALIGIIIQWKFTGKGFDHTDVIIRRNQNRIRTHLVRHPQETARRQQRNDQRRQRGRSRENQRRQQQRRSNPTEFHRTRETTASRASSRERGRTAASSGNVRNTTVDQNFDTLPPSYDDCMRHGVGKPVTESDRQRIVRTDNGSYLAPHDNPSFTENTASTGTQSVNAERGPRNATDGVSNFVPGRRRRRSASGGRRASSGSNRSAGARRSGRARNAANRSSGRSQSSGQQPSGLSPGDDRESLLRT